MILRRQLRNYLVQGLGGPGQRESRQASGSMIGVVTEVMC